MNITIPYSMHQSWLIMVIACITVIESPHGGGIGDLSGRLSDLSIASGSSSLQSGHGVGADDGDRERHEDASYRPHCCRSCKSLPEYVYYMHLSLSLSPPIKLSQLAPIITLIFLVFQSLDLPSPTRTLEA